MEEQWNAGPQGTLCRLCRDLLEEIQWTEGHRHHVIRRESFHADHSWEDSLMSGCSICNAVAHEWTKLDKTVVRAERFHGGKTIDITFEGETKLNSDIARICFTLGELTDRSLFDAVRSHGNPISETVTDQDLDLVNTWMSLCVNRHEQCLSNLHPESYPTRLLAVQDDVVRLKERRNETFSGPYATLSYSWGQTRFEVLTKQTLAKFKHGIRPEDLLPTFSDAIKVCRKLAIFYLWIDCFCILQPERAGTRDPEQAHELAEMSDIYSNAVLNLGFGAAQSPFDGFSVSRALRPQCWIELPLMFDDGVRSFIFINGKARRDLEDERRKFSEPRVNAIFKRAWCLQERFMSRRMVHFCRSGLFWECDTLQLTSDILPVSQIHMMEPGPTLPPFSLST